METSTNAALPVPLARLVLPEPPLRVRLWACLHNIRAWRTRRKMDKAVCAMIRDGINTPLAYELMIESCKQWDAAFEKYRQNVRPLATCESAADRRQKPL